MSEGDLIVMPVKSQQKLAIGEITGPYRHRDDKAAGFRHVRPVRWIRTDVDASEFQPDLRSSLGSLLTVCQLSRHEAVQRISEVVARRPDPGWRHVSASVAPDATLADLWEAVEAGAEPVKLTVRELLAKWGFGRRTATSLETVQAELADRGISTKPPFTTARMDMVVELVQVAAEPDASPDQSGQSDLADTEALDELPTKWRVQAILPDEPSIERISPDQPLTAAITVMLARNYSQLAVVDEHEDYKGAVSWESIGRARLTNPDATLRDATEKVRVVDYDDELFDQIDEIYRRGYVLVRGDDRRTLIGIITASDLARQFGTLARPFSILEEIELRLRRNTKRCIPEDTLIKIVPKWANGNPTFGNYVKIFTELDNFELTKWPLDHQTFLDLLTKVKNIRNELMHFSGEMIPEHDLTVIEGFCAMIRAVDQSAQVT